MTEVETCCVADEFCLAPANLEPPKRAMCMCFSCGQAVCSKCSSIHKYYHYGRVRLCNNCQVSYDSNEKRVVARLNRMARGK